MQHHRRNISDEAYRKKLYAPVKSNLPSNAFADDVVTNDDIGTFYTQSVGVVSQWGTLGDYTHKERDRIS